MYRQKRSDTRVRTVEDTYGLTFNCRSDALLGNLLESRGYSSQSELVRAARGQLTEHPRPRRVFLSFHREDLQQVTGFRLMMRNDRLALDISDDDSRYPVQSEHSTYIKAALRRKIKAVEVLICMIGNATAWRDWVEWEIQTGLEERKGICGVRLKGSNGRTPAILKEIGAPIAGWGDVEAITRVIEQAAACRS